MKHIAQIQDESLAGMPFITWVRHNGEENEDPTLITVLVLLEIPVGYIFEQPQEIEEGYKINLTKKSSAKGGIHLFTSEPCPFAEQVPFTIKVLKDEIETPWHQVRVGVIATTAATTHVLNPKHIATPFLFPTLTNDGTLSNINVRVFVPEGASITLDEGHEDKNYNFHIIGENLDPNGEYYIYQKTFTPQYTPEDTHISFSVSMSEKKRKVLVSTQDGTVTTGNKP